MVTPLTPPTIRIFDGVSAIAAGGPVDLGGPKQRAVLAVLLLEPGTSVSIDRLVDLVWGDDAPGRAEVSIRGYVSNLRRAAAFYSSMDSAWRASRSQARSLLPRSVLLAC